jgi:ABC-type multidrug transport system fused ATPase/permease subunit
MVCNWVAGHIVDSLLRPDAMHQVWKYATVLFCYALLAAVCAYLSYILWIRIGSQIGIKLRRLLLKSYVSNDVTFFDTHSIGQLLSLLSSDVKTVENVFTTAKTQQGRFCGQFLSSILLTFTVHWQLAILNLVSVFLGSWIVKAVRGFGAGHMRQKAANLAKSTTIAVEALGNARIVYSFNRQKQEVLRFDEQMDEACGHDRRNRWFVGAGVACGFFLNWGTVALVLNLGCYAILRGRMTTGQLFAVARACFIAGIGLRNLLATWHSETIAMDAGSRVFEMVDMRPAVPMSGGRRLDNFRGKIQFRNVWFKYPARPSIWVLRNVSFTVEAGEIVALVGHSGSGKSTIVQLLLRFYDVDEGEILFDDVPIRYLSPRWIHQVVGVVQQDPQLFSMSVRDNIAYSVGRTLSEEALMAAAKVSYSEEFIMKMDHGYDSMITEKGGNISGGQRQRIAIARAIVRNPTILVTDEATSALDAASEQEVQRALDGVMKGRTSLIIAHRLGTIKAAGMIHVFEMGELVESGTHEQLIAMDGHYARLVSRQLASEMGRSTSTERMDDL